MAFSIKNTFFFGLFFLVLVLIVILTARVAEIGNNDFVYSLASEVVVFYRNNGFFPEGWDDLDMQESNFITNVKIADVDIKAFLDGQNLLLLEDDNKEEYLNDWIRANIVNEAGSNR